MQSLRRGRGADIAVADDTSLDADEIPDDAVVALQLLREQFPPSAGAGGVYPVALVSQIYSLVPDRTAVDRQLDKAMRRQEVRLFRWVCASLVPALVCLGGEMCGTGKCQHRLTGCSTGRMLGHATDNLAMAADDYEAAVRRAVGVFVAKRKGGSRGGAGKQPRLSGDAARSGRQPCTGSDGEDEDRRGFQSTAAEGGSNSRDWPIGPSTEEIVDRFLYGVLPETPRVSISAFDIKASLAAPRNALVGGPPPKVACAAGRADGVCSAKSAREANERPLRKLTADEAEVPACLLVRTTHATRLPTSATRLPASVRLRAYVRACMHVHANVLLAV
jgi:hypothetical protein